MIKLGDFGVAKVLGKWERLILKFVFNYFYTENI